MRTHLGRRVAMLVYNDLMHDARVHREATTLVEAGFDVRVIGMRTEDAPRLVGWDAISVARVGVGASGSLRVRYARFWRSAYLALMDLHPAAVHAHDLDVLAPAWLAARRLDVPLVYDAHELWTELPSLVGRPFVRGIWRSIARTLVPRADAVITVGSAVADELARRYRVSPTVLRNLPTRREPPTPVPLRERVQCGPDTPLLLYQGSLMTGYGIERAIAAMDLLPDAHLVIIGGGPLTASLRRQAARSPSSRRITFLPPVPFKELPAYTSAADLGLFLGESQGLNLQLSLPNKLFEYIAAGVPFVSTDWPETGRLVRQYGVGQLVKPGAGLDEIAAAIRRALERHEALVRNCRAAREELIWENEAEKLIALYHRLPWR